MAKVFNVSAVFLETGKPQLISDGKISKDNNPYVVQSVLLPKAARIGQKLCGSVDFALDILRTIPNGDKYIKTDDNVAAARNTSIGKC